MKKSVYSLVLSEDVVEAVDRAAYLSGTSRSNFINRVLAEHLSCITPELRMRDIFGIIEEYTDEYENFRIYKQSSDSMFSLLSSLKYKYRPTIRYCVELYSDFKGGEIGEIKIVYRTQSAEFAELMNNFFLLWAEVEQKHIGKTFEGSHIKYSASDGKLIRTLVLSENSNNEDEKLGRTIFSYIKTLDKTLKEYAAIKTDVIHAKKMIEKEYLLYLKNNTMLI